jgi:hypothetical protein
MPPPFGPQTFIVLFMFLKLFAEEQRRRKAPLLETRLLKPPPGNGIRTPARSQTKH